MSIDRRRFLALSGASLGVAFSTACNSEGPKVARRLLRLAERRNETVERLLFRHTSMDVVRPGARSAGDAFPSYFVSEETPVWDAAARGAWTLEVSGAVRAPRTFTLAQLMALPSRTQRVNHYCVEGWTAVATWSGVRVSELARIVQPSADAGFVDFASFDGDYHESWDIESAMHPQTLIAYGMDDHPLSPAHGAPARLHSPVKLGYKNTKYLTRITFLPAHNGGYWTDRGYDWYGGT